MLSFAPPRLLAALSFAGLLASATGSSAATPLDPSGVWLTEDGRARIRVEKCGTKQDRICGFVVWLKATKTEDGKPLIDLRNPDPKKRGRAALGHQLMMGLAPGEESRYEGKIYNSEDGKLYDISIWLEGQNTLNVRGCLIAFLCKTQAWTRTRDAAPGQLVGATGTPTGPRPDPEWVTAYHDASGSEAKKSSASATRP